MKKFILFIIILISGYLYILNKPVNTTTKIVAQSSKNMLISKQTVDDLVNKAAQQKYLQDIFNGDQQKLPIPKQTALMPYQSDLKTPLPIKPSLSRCTYNTQNYMAGDIVKTPDGWIRCVPTINFLPDKTSRQSGQPVWIAVQ